MLSTILYSRRFFPYYTYNIVAGLDAEGIIAAPLHIGSDKSNYEL
jgi:20S proteasome alpha/beta subunit